MPGPLVHRTRIRLALDLRKPTEPLRDLIRSAQPVIPVGGDVQLEVAVFDNSVLGGLSDLDSVTMNISKTDKTSIDGIPDITKTLAAADLNLALTQEQWDAGDEDDCHFKIVLTDTETNLATTELSATYHLVIFGITTDVPANTVPFGEGNVTLHDFGLRATGTPPVNDPLYYTKAESDARYLGVEGVPLTGLTGGTTGKLDAIATVDLSVDEELRRVVRTVSGARILSEWFLVAGTDAEDVDGGIVRPDDYNASTNAKVWVRVAGL